MSDFSEWYPRECEFCTREAALACEDARCRAEGKGEPHLEGCPSIASRTAGDCTCAARCPMTAPESSTGTTRDLAEKMARAWHEHVAHVPWDQVAGKDRLVAVAERRLRAFRAAGLAVVDRGERADVLRLIRQGVSDPGATVVRGMEKSDGSTDYTETLISWNARAVAAKLHWARLLGPYAEGSGGEFR